MAITLEALEQRTRRLALILSNLTHIPLEEILQYTEAEKTEGTMDYFVDPKASDALKDFVPDEPEPEVEPQEPSPDELP